MLRIQDGGPGEHVPFKRQEKAKKLVRETEKGQRGGRKVRRLGEKRVARRGDSGRAKRRSSASQEGAGDFRKGQFREARGRGRCEGGSASVAVAVGAWHECREKTRGLRARESLHGNSSSPGDAIHPRFTEDKVSEEKQHLLGWSSVPLVLL